MDKLSGTNAPRYRRNDSCSYLSAHHPATLRKVMGEQRPLDLVSVLYREGYSFKKAGKKGSNMGKTPIFRPS